MHAPLQIVRPGILVLALGAEGTHVARTVVHEAVADHFILALEAFAALGALAALDGAVVRAHGAVDVAVRTDEGEVSCRVRALLSYGVDT